MEGISRAKLDRICQLLRENTSTSNTEEKEKLAKMLEDFDVIPKLYAFTYFKKVFQELKQLKGEGSIDMDEFNQFSENADALFLGMFKTKTEVNKLLNFLENGMERMTGFCDFEDSRYHNQTKMCTCQSEEHFEDLQESEVLSPEDYKAYQKMCETDEGHDKAQEHFADKLNPITECKPFYMSNDNTEKWDDDPIWTCKICENRHDGSDGDYTVNCDMDVGL